MTPSRFSALVAIAFVAGCSSDSPTEPSPIASGTLTFEFVHEAVPETFTASGAPETGADGFLPGTWAVGGRLTNPNALAVFGLRQLAGREDFAMIFVPEHAAGTFHVDPECDWADRVCVDVVVYLDIGGSAERECVLTDGSVQVSTVGARLQGTFSGTGTCSGAPDEGESLEEPPFTISGGAFDVALVDLNL